MRAVKLAFALATAVVFACLLLFDTTALLRLAGMCLAGQCGVPSWWIAAAVACVAVVGVARSLWRRRAASRRPQRRTPAGRKPAKPKRAGARTRRSA